MGGVGSGSRGFRARCEDMHPVDLADLNRRGLKVGTVCAMRWMRAGRECGRAEVVLQAISRLRLQHVAPLGDGAETRSPAIVSLISTKQPIGGVREWFECPRLPSRLSRTLRPSGLPLSSVRQSDLCLSSRTCLRSRSARGTETAHAARGLAVVGTSLPGQALHDALEDLSQAEAAARPPDRTGVRPTVGEAGEVAEGLVLNSVPKAASR